MEDGRHWRVDSSTQREKREERGAKKREEGALNCEVLKIARLQLEIYVPCMAFFYYVSPWPETTHWPLRSPLSAAQRRAASGKMPPCGQAGSRLLPNKGGARHKTSRRTTSFGPSDVFVGIIWPRTRQKRSLVANGFG
jgi:hypothetical protein